MGIFAALSTLVPAERAFLALDELAPELIGKARTLMGDDADDFEDALRLLAQDNRAWWTFLTATIATSQQDELNAQFRTDADFHDLSDATNRADGLCIVCAMAVEEECPVRSPDVLAALFSDAKAAAEQHHTVLAAWISDRAAALGIDVGPIIPPAVREHRRSDPMRIIGLFADDPDLMTDVCEAAMTARERDPLRRSDA
jgi:hypothetical protein